MRRATALSRSALAASTTRSAGLANNSASVVTRHGAGTASQPLLVDVERIAQFDRALGGLAQHVPREETADRPTPQQTNAHYSHLKILLEIDMKRWSLRFPPGKCYCFELVNKSSNLRTGHPGRPLPSTRPQPRPWRATNTTPAGEHPTKCRGQLPREIVAEEPCRVGQGGGLLVGLRKPARTAAAVPPTSRFARPTLRFRNRNNARCALRLSRIAARRATPYNDGCV